MDGDVMVERDDFEPGELDALLAEGERCGKPLKGEGVFEELRQLGSARKKKIQRSTGIRVRLPMPPAKKRK